MKIFGRDVGDGYPVFIIAEIGQNHQGSMEVAKEMIVRAKEIGVDCIKFQKSCLPAKFTRKALERSYTGENSWGRTYGEHKTHLEFSLSDYRALQKFCSDIGILFSASAMDPISLEHLTELQLPFIKIGSGDADNIPLLRKAAVTDIPLVISTGMQSWDQVQHIYSIFKNKPIALLHCVSAYPTPPSESLLKLIPLYKRYFPDIVIGYSGHELGLQLTLASVLLGARIVERHFTLDKDWKGTDHKASLDPAEFGRLVGYIRCVENLRVNHENIINLLSKTLNETDYNRDELLLALKQVSASDRKLLGSEVACHSKLGKSLVFMRDVLEGQSLTAADVGVKVSEPHGLAPIWFDRVLGLKVVHTCRQDEPIQEGDVAMRFSSDLY
ncbi:sialic acid synthase [Topomyia yanbarensis]|uniref:sialic acid synthase n=1 Tax=Topomyia yanbarensis TaxID=2498891 RepID=UPI00273BC294|nr:sialic acid synthase [Topomyia yanbarensis]